jgi:hypothetical protein
MQISKKVLLPIILFAILGGSVSNFATEEPLNQCVMIPEIFVGPSSFSNYQPDSCVALRMDDKSNYAADSRSHTPGY